MLILRQSLSWQKNHWSRTSRTLPMMLALLPEGSAKSSPHDLQFLLMVVCENTIAFSPHFVH
jgi:hypothetical protein